MKASPKKSQSLLAAATFVGLLSAGIPSVANAGPSVFDLPAGLACAGFDLRIEITASTQRVNRDFYDRSGNIVRTLSAGKGDALTFVNLATGAMLSLRPNGAVTRVVLNADGTQTYTSTGHNVLILFPSDVPAGPSTTLYVGRIAFTVDPSGVFTLQSTSGKSMDICAALSS